MKNKTLTDARNTIANRPRKWRKPVPCPICGDKGIKFHTYDFSFCWNVACAGCRRSAVILTKHTDHKEAIRAGNYLAADYKKAKENAK